MKKKFNTIEEAYKVAGQPGDFWNDWSEHINRIVPVFHALWLNKNDQEVEEGEIYNYDGVKYEFDQEIDLFDTTDEIYSEEFGHSESNADELMQEVTFGLKRQIEEEVTAEDGNVYNLKFSDRQSFVSKYSYISVFNKNQNDIGTIEFRLADHTYNPANNSISAKEGNFISLEIANDNKTEGRFWGKFSLKFSGDDTFEEVVETVKERIMEIINEWDLDELNKEADSYEGGGIINKQKYRGHYTIKNSDGTFYSVQIMFTDEYLRPSDAFFTVQVKLRRKDPETGEVILSLKNPKTYPVQSFDSFMEDLEKRGGKHIDEVEDDPEPIPKKTISLPDTECSEESLKRVLDMQGYGLIRKNS